MTTRANWHLPLLAAALGALLTVPTSAGERMPAAQLKPAPVFDALDSVPGRDKWASGESPAATYRNLPEILPSRRIAAAATPAPLLAPTEAFQVSYTFGGKRHALEDFPARTDTTGLLILKGNHILFEGYYQGGDSQDQFLSFSTGKSFVSTLVALAIGEGKIASIEDPVIKYLPEVAGSAYATARIKDVLQMSSGTSYTEEYEDPKSDIATFLATINASAVIKPVTIGGPSGRGLARPPMGGALTASSETGAFANAGLIALVPMRSMSAAYAAVSSRVEMVGTPTWASIQEPIRAHTSATSSTLSARLWGRFPGCNAIQEPPSTAMLHTNAMPKLQPIGNRPRDPPIDMTPKPVPRPARTQLVAYTINGMRP